MIAAIQVKEKLERYEAIDKVKEETLEYLTNLYKNNEK